MAELPSHCSGEARELVLASSSPRRRDLLNAIGLSFEVDASTAPEVVGPGLDVRDVVRELSVAKALDVAPRHPHALIIAADTLVTIDGQVLGKPRDRDEARAMLRGLSGRRHDVFTGVVVMDGHSLVLRTRIVETAVYFRKLAPAEIDAYVRMPEPFDKAGSYGIQGIGAVFVERIDGDYSNVVGLPLVALNQLLTETGCCIICHQSRPSRASFPRTAG